ncbi:MAG: aminotransferase class I/II-fold pyridoxal phosphate-dependent enzyme [Alphaproteobacteria bacterium]|nr:aminotransferase class I/II-fold pyridoxal phosphate-dependent enzyme [Alphaproteobacteria bacterium]
MLNPRLEQLADYPFTRLAALLNGLQPGGEPLIMSIGEPQHAAPALLADALNASAHLWGKYPPVQGTPEFRASAGNWLKRRYGLPAQALDADKTILPVAGTREALYLAAQMCVPDSKRGHVPAVLIPNPFYQVYFGAAVLSGAEPVMVDAPQGVPDFSLVPPSILERTALAYLCSPANPQGSVANLKQLEAAIATARQHGFVLAVDECYAEIWDMAPPPGALQAAWDLSKSFDNVLVFHSLSKRSSVPGLRSGFVAGDAKLIEAFSRLRSYGGATLALPVLSASTALWNDEAHVTENQRLYRAKLDLAERHLGRHPGFARPEGGFFIWLDVGDGEAAAKKLWQKTGIRVLPGAYLSRPSANGRNPGAPFVRIALVHDLPTTDRALAAIAATLLEGS